MRPSVRARFLQTLACAGCALLLPASALAAAGSPLHIDPASPVAKEYALPLATARGAPPESGKSGKLFGSGIKHASTTTSHTTSAPPTTTPPTTTPTTAPTSVPPATTPAEQPSTEASTSATPTSTPTQAPTPSPRHRRHHPEHVTTVTLPALTTPTTQTTRPATARATPAAYRVLRPGSGSGLLWMALAAVVVVAVGSAGGFALSRRR